MYNNRLNGSIFWLEHDSLLLKGNRLGDPHIRRFPVYLPPDYEGGSNRYPVIYALAGFTGTGPNMVNFAVWDESIPEQIDRLISGAEAAPAIVVMPDCFTKLGGSQYINSAAMGPYRNYLIEEIIPFIDKQLRTLPDRRGALGKSSGGFGALSMAMTHPGTFAAVASHSGDLCFDYAYRNEFPAAINTLNDAGGLEKFLARFGATSEKGPLIAALNIVAMAAAYSPNSTEIELPFDLPSGRLRRIVWDRWLAVDPLQMIDNSDHAAALKNLRLLWLDAGRRDEYALHLGARMFSAKLTNLGVAHHYEEHDGGHRGNKHRFTESLKAVARALAD